jgi:glyoxylase-like metal-dependent hydrolase (beta-lactamase superfamily II)
VGGGADRGQRVGHKVKVNLVKELIKAQVMAMEQDVSALRNMKPGGKTHSIDRVLHDGDEVKLGGTTLVAHRTAGHTKGCTTYARLDKGGPNPFIDPEGFKAHVDRQEKNFMARLEEQKASK